MKYFGLVVIVLGFFSLLTLVKYAAKDRIYSHKTVNVLPLERTIITEYSK